MTRGKPPAASGLSELVRRLDAAASEAALARPVRSRAPAPPAAEPVALAGKAVRGSRDGEVPGQHWVAAYAPLGEAVLVQVDAKANAHQAAPQLRGTLPVRGRGVTGGALFCQRDLCQAIVGQGGDYLSSVKDNQPGLATDVAAGFGCQAAARSIAAAFSP